MANNTTAARSKVRAALIAAGYAPVPVHPALAARRAKEVAK